MKRWILEIKSDFEGCQTEGEVEEFVAANIPLAGDYSFTISEDIEEGR